MTATEGAGLAHAPIAAIIVEMFGSDCYDYDDCTVLTDDCAIGMVRLVCD